MIDVVAGRPNDTRGFVHKKFFGFVGGVVKTGINIASNLPGPSGFVPSILQKFINPPPLPIQGPPPIRANPFTPPPAQSTGQGGQVGIGEINVNVDPRAITSGSGVAGSIAPVGTEMLCPSGFHLNQSAYNLKGGARVEKRTRCVKNRHRNPDNGKASLKAARRLVARNKRQALVDKALRIIAPAKRRAAAPKALPKGTTIVQN